jgi:cyclohexanecarboxyl-CoA dehydrogenase
MKFSFSEEEDLLRWAVREFAEKEIAHKEWTEFDSAFRSTIKKIGELGFLSLGIPEEYGGNEGSSVMQGIVAEELARADVAVAYYLMVFYEVSLALATYGTVRAQEEWLPRLVKGTILPCISTTEHDAGVDVSAATGELLRHGDFYVASGEKSPVSFGMVADVSLSFLRGIRDYGREDGMTAVLIPLSLPGVERSPLSTMGLAMTACAAISLNRVQVPEQYRVGGEGDGIRIHHEIGIRSAFNQVISALICLGAAQSALNLTVAYSKKRFAFGKPIVRFEAISSKIAECTTLIEAAKWLCYRALYLKDQGLRSAKESAMCGWWCPKIATQVVQDCLLIHGHAGYCTELPFQQILRDLVGFEMISGTQEMLKLIVSREAVGPVAVPENIKTFISQ